MNRVEYYWEELKRNTSPENLKMVKLVYFYGVRAFAENLTSTTSVKEAQEVYKEVTKMLLDIESVK